MEFRSEGFTLFINVEGAEIDEPNPVVAAVSQLGVVLVKLLHHGRPELRLRLFFRRLVLPR